MATLRLHLYRVRAYEQLRQETGASGDDPRPWQATSQIVLHARAHHFHRNNQPSGLERLRGEPVIKAHLAPSLEHLVLAREACPLLAEVHVTLGELSAVLVDPAADGVHIERARRLGPSDLGLLFRCGLLDLQAGRIEAACESWQACLSLSDRYLDDVLVLAARHLSAARTVEDVLPESPALLVRLARERYQVDEQEEMRRLLAERAGRLLDEVDLPEDERHYLRAAAFSLRGLDSEAIASLLRAVELRPGEASWRYEVAVLLNRAGRIDEGHKQARLAARLAPRNGTYRALLKEINHARAAADG
jgi:tetratricopeptide (TPR) repeat protein